GGPALPGQAGHAGQAGEIRADVRERFGIEMDPDHVSTTKGEIAREQPAARKAKKPAKAPAVKDADAPQPVSPGQTSPSPAGEGPGAALVSLEDVSTVKSLVDRGLPPPRARRCLRALILSPALWRGTADGGPVLEACRGREHNATRSGYAREREGG